MFLYSRQILGLVIGGSKNINDWWFNIMINDILEAVRSVPGVKALLYADDLLIQQQVRYRLSNTMQEAIQIANTVASADRQPVSYTHLDVYKRQSQYNRR